MGKMVGDWNCGFCAFCFDVFDSISDLDLR